MDILYRRNGRVAGRVLDGRYCLMHPGTSELTVLNETGTRLWELLAAPAAVADLAGRLAAEFDVTDEAARADVERFVGRLVALDLLQELP